MTDYKGYKIEPVFHYTNGKSDFQVYPPHGEYGEIYPSTTVEEIIEELNEKLDELQMR